MLVYKCDRCGRELARRTYDPCYSPDLDKIVYHVDFGEGENHDLCVVCHTYLKSCFMDKENPE